MYVTIRGVGVGEGVGATGVAELDAHALKPSTSAEQMTPQSTVSAILPVERRKLPTLMVSPPLTNQGYHARGPPDRADQLSQ